MTSIIKIVPLGGTGNVTNNMYVYESDKDIIIVDCGIGFPDDQVPGIDLTIPDISYLKNKINKIRAIFLSHAHEDHIGGLPYLLPQLGEHLPLYASRLTAGFIKEKLKEFSLSDKMVSVLKDRTPLTVGDFQVTFLAITHSIPDAKHILIKTPLGTIYHGSDFKFDWTPVQEQLPDIYSIAKAGHQGITLLLSDSLRAERDGYSPSESTIAESFEREFKDVAGKIILTTMSSNISRIQQALDVARRFNRKVAFVGRSIEKNIRIAKQLGFLNFPQKLIINKRRIDHFPPHKLCLIVAGSQGQLDSSLVRIAEGDHDITISPQDKVIFSADPIPGNAKNVYRLVDILTRNNINVVYSDLQDDLHVSGHASARELMMLMALTKPQYLMPIGGTYRHMRQYAKLAQQMGFHPDQILLSHNQIIRLQPGGLVSLGEKINLKTIYVEGEETNIPESRLQDRQLMFQQGAIVVLITLPTSSQQQPTFDLIPRGIITNIPSQTIQEIKTYLTSTLKPQDFNKDRLFIKSKIAKLLNKFFINKLSLNPLIIPIVVEA